MRDETLQEIKQRFEDVTRTMSQPEIATDPVKMQALAREHTQLKGVVQVILKYEAAQDEMVSLREMIAENEDPSLTKMAEEELSDLQKQMPDLEEELRYKLIPKDPEDSKNAIVEIRAGSGGDEASLFAGDLLRMYTRLADSKGWKVEVLGGSEGTKGGFKEVSFGLQGADAYGVMKFESGVHRVQRVPQTESAGRIHTSAATVAVLPEAEEVDVDIKNEDLEIDVYRSSGPGGQSVNTTDSAVRITHKPTGLVVTCQDEKSQHKNKDKALRVLRARLYDLERSRLEAERSDARNSMIGSGDRSAKIRTYNWPQGRVTDHRLEGDNKNHALQGIVDGKLDELTKALRAAEHAMKLASAANG